MKEAFEVFSKLYLLITGSTIIFMFANAWGGLVVANFKNKIDWGLFVKSLFKYLGILVMATLLYLGFKLGGQAVYNGLGINIPIEEIISLGLISILLKYAKDSLSKWEELTNVEIIEQVKNQLGRNEVGQQEKENE